MAVDGQSKTRMSLFDTGLLVYRKTLKRFRLVHVAVHWLMTHTLIPFLQRVRRFQTMPDDPFWFRLELLTNRHEHETTTHVRRLVHSGMTVLDIGAHVGYYARLTSNLVGETGRIVCFEPHPRNRQFLEQNTASAGNVTILPVAVAEEEGTAELYDYLMMSASGSLHYDESLRETQRQQLSDHDYSPRLATDHAVEKYTVRTAVIDDCLKELGISSVDFVKMDIEGAEMGGLRGMKQTIAQSPQMVLVMEYNPMGLKAFGNDPEASIQEVLGMGFARVQVIEPDGRLTDITDDADATRALTLKLTRNMGVVNLLFTRVV